MIAPEVFSPDNTEITLGTFVDGEARFTAMSSSDANSSSSTITPPRGLPQTVRLERLVTGDGDYANPSAAGYSIASYPFLCGRRFRSWRLLHESIIRPSSEIVTTCQGINLPDSCNALFADISSPPQHGTSMQTIVTD